MVVVCELMEYYVRISSTEFYEFIFLAIVFAVEYDDILVWNLLKSPNNSIDTFGVGESRK